MKAQIGIEFISVFFLMLVIFVFIQLSTSVRTNSLLERQTQLGAVKAVEAAELSINFVGYSQALTTPFELPPFLPGGFNYTFLVSNSSLSITWNNGQGSQSVVRTLYAFNVTNATGSRQFNLLPGRHFATKNSGGVRVT